MASNLRIWRRPWDRQPDAGARLRDRYALPGSAVFVPSAGLLVGPYENVGINTSGEPAGLGVIAQSTSGYGNLRKLPRLSPGAATFVWVLSRASGTLRYLCGTVDTGTTYLDQVFVSGTATESTSAGRIGLAIRSTSGQARSSATPTTALNLGQIHTVVAQVVDSVTHRIFVDGVEQALTYSTGGTGGTVAASTGNVSFDYALMNRNVRGAFSNGATDVTAYLFARLPTNDIDIEQFSSSPASAFDGLFEPRRIWVPVSAGGGDVSVALSGQAATVSAGTLTPTQSLALSGQAATVSAGTLAPTRSLDLSGSAATVSAGALTPARSFSLTGSSVAASAGSFGLSSAVPLVGSGATFSAGNLTYSAGGNVTLALTGSVITTAAGSLALERTFALGGSQVTVSAGTLLLLRSIALAGSSATSAAGTITPSTSGNITLALTGAQVLAYAGIIVPSGGAPILTVFPPDYGFVTAGSRVVRVVRGTPLQRVATGSRRSSVRG